jgi:DNA polymerase III sliding clamp (beta) subunit (PCNA family)
MSVGIDDAIPLEVAFNPSYFRDATLHAGDGATVYLRDGLKAAVIDNGDAYALIMPMRVS